MLCRKKEKKKQPKLKAVAARDGHEDEDEEPRRSGELILCAMVTDC